MRYINKSTYKSIKMRTLCANKSFVSLILCLIGVLGDEHMYKLVGVQIGMQATQKIQFLNGGDGGAADFGDVNENTNKCTHTYARKYVYRLEYIICMTPDLEHQAIYIK